MQSPLQLTPSPLLRVLQIGNAVSPPLATGLGGCLLLAAAEEAPVATPVVEARLHGGGGGIALAACLPRQI